MRAGTTHININLGHSVSDIRTISVSTFKKFVVGEYAPDQVVDRMYDVNDRSSASRRYSKESIISSVQSLTQILQLKDIYPYTYKPEVINSNSDYDVSPNKKKFSFSAFNDAAATPMSSTLLKGGVYKLKRISLEGCHHISAVR